MNDGVGVVLGQIITNYGPEVSEDARRVEALLQDLSGEYRREISVLAGAAREGVPAQLRSWDDSVSGPLFAERLVRLLQDNLGLEAAAAHWGVTTWAAALGVPISTSPGPVTEAASAPAPAGALTISSAPPRVIAVPSPAPSPAVARARVRSKKSVSLIISLVLLLLLGGTVGVMAWVRHGNPPVLQPSGLTLDTSTTSSVSLRWSEPTSGPVPDRYVIFRNGQEVGTVPGTVTYFQARGLPPASTFSFRVEAVRGGKTSPESGALTTTTLTPPISEARLQGPWTVDYTVTSSNFTRGDKTGDHFTGQWIFSPKCARGSCGVALSLTIAYAPVNVSLMRNGATYTGTVQTNGDTCLDNNGEITHEPTTLRFTIIVSSGKVVNGEWLASKWTGTMINTSDAFSVCTSLSATYSVSGSPQ